MIDRGNDYMNTLPKHILDLTTILKDLNASLYIRLYYYIKEGIGEGRNSCHICKRDMLNDLDIDIDKLNKGLNKLVKKDLLHMIPVNGYEFEYVINNGYEYE